MLIKRAPSHAPADAGFLEEVRNNPWAARKLREDADKAEEALAEGGEEGGMLQVNDMRDAVVVINSAGIITVVNPMFLKMFGYKRQEDVVGKNCSIFMPPPYDKAHDSYIENYMRTGEAKILGVRQQLEGRHADGCAQTRREGARRAQLDS